MFELMGIVAFIFFVGLVTLLVGVLVLPFYLFFKVLGFLLRVGIGGILFGLAALVLLPIFLLIGVFLLLKLLLIAVPLLIAVVLLSWFVGFFRQPAPA